MIKYTKAAIEITIRDLKLYCRIAKYTFASLTMAYFIYALVVGMGNMVVNIILLSLLAIYTVLDIVIDAKPARRIVRHSYHWLKLSIKAFTLGATLYGVYEASSNISPVTIILLTLMIILWVLQFILEVVVITFERKKELILDAIEKDVEDTKDIYRKPADAVKSFIKTVTGQPQEEVVEEKEDNKNIKRIKKYLDNQNKK